MSLRRNAIYLTGEKAVHTLGGLLSMVLVARVLGTDALADYGFAISLTAFFIPFLDIGMNNRIIKSVAAGEDFTFGKARGGNFERLVQLGKDAGIQERAVPPVMKIDIRVFVRSNPLRE